MNHFSKLAGVLVCLLFPLAASLAQTTSGVDADSRFIAIGVHGYDPTNPRYGGADNYFATNAMRDLGPSGDYSNISAYHLLGSPNADGKDYIRQIGDFNSSFDSAYKSQTGLTLKDPDKDGTLVNPLISNNQPFISMAKVEWVYRNTIDGEFIGGLADKRLPGIARAVDVMISDGPQYKDLLGRRLRRARKYEDQNDDGTGQIGPH